MPFVLGMLGFLIIVGIVLKIIVDVTEAKKRKEAAQRAITIRKEAKNKLRENKLLQLAVDATVTHIAELKRKAEHVVLPGDTHDFYIGTITKNNLHFETGLKKGERPHVSASEDWHYDKYSIWLHGLTSVLFIDYETEGFCPLDEVTMVLFLEVFAEELKKAGCPIWNERYNSEDRAGMDALLIWDLTQYHPKKELKPFV